MSSEPPASTTFNPSSTHILGRDGAPIPKQPQSSVRPRASADSSAEKKTTEMNATASAPTRRVGRQGNRRPHAISNGGRLNASRLNERRRQDTESRDAVSELQRIAHLLGARVDKNCSQPQTQGERSVIVDSTGASRHGPLPLDTGSPAFDHSSHPPVKTLTLLKPRDSNAFATRRLS